MRLKDIVSWVYEAGSHGVLAGSESRPPMLNKENYVTWSSRLLRYAKSRPNGKLIHNSIINGPYVRRMIPEPGDTNREVFVNEIFHVQTDDELTKKELKQIEADDQAIQTILLGLPEDIYAVVDSCEIAQEIWLRVQQMMKGSDIGIQEKKAKLFNEWKRFTSNNGESIESYYHRFLKLINDLKRNKHFPEKIAKKIASNLKFLNNLQPEWSRHVTIIHQTKDLHTADYTQLYDFLKYNQKDVDELKAERLTKTQDPLALMANSNNPYAFPAPHQDQPSFNQNYMQHPMPNPENITYPTTAMNMALALMGKALKLNYLTPTNNNQKISSNPRNRQIAQPSMNMGQDRWMQMVGVQNPRVQNIGNQNGLIGVPGNANQNLNGNGNLVAARAEGNATRHNDAAIDLDEIEEVNANCILIANLQQASTSGTQTDKAPVYDSDRSAEVHDYENCYDNEIFNMFTQEEQYTELLEPIPEPHQVLQNNNTCRNHKNKDVQTMDQTDTYYNGLTLRHRDTINAAAGGTFMKRRPEECYDLIENMTAHHNDWDTSAQRSESSSSITSSSDLEIVELKAKMEKINKNLMKVLQINQQVKAVTLSCETCGGPHSYNDCPATVGQTQNVYVAGAYQGGNYYQPQGNHNLLSYRSNNYIRPQRFNQNQNRNNQNQNFQNQNRNQGNNHGIPQGNNQGRNQFFQGASHGPNPPPVYQAPAYQAPGYQALVHQPPIPQPQVVTTTEFTNYMKANDAILKNMQTNMSSLTNSNLELKNMFGQFMKMNTALSSGSRTLQSNTVTNPKEDLKGITTQSGTAYQGPMIPTTSSSSSQVVEREIEVTQDMVPLTNNESTKDVQPPVVQVKTLVPNSEPVVASVSAPKPNPKPSIPYPSRLHDQKLRDKTNDQKEKFFKIFQDLNFNIRFTDALILMPKFGPTIKSLLTNKYKMYELARTPLNKHCSAVLLKKLPEKLGDPCKFLIPSNRINVIDMACEEYSQEVLGFSDVIASGNPTPYYDPIISTSSPTLTPFGDSDFILEEVDAFLALEDDPTSSEVDNSYYDPKGDILLLEAFLIDDPSLPPLNQRMYLPQVQKELKICEAKSDKSSIDEPPEVELKDLPPHLEYAFFEGNDKFPVIISNDLSVKEKATLIKVLKSHKQAIAWKLSDIKGINPEFYTHKILMENDFEPAVQHQRRVNIKIYDVIKKEVLKLLDAGLIYPISDSPWVSLVHCVPKKGGFTAVQNEENELIPTRLVTGWCVCIGYRKLNEATRKDHFPLPFMDQMLDRLAGNEYYCFLDGFSGYFQIPIDPKDQENTTFTCLYGTFAYRRMPFRLCNTPGTLQRCTMVIFYDMIEKTMEVFMDDFSVFGNSYETCLSHLDKMLKWCEDTNLCLNWEKSHFLVKEGIVLGHKISKNRIEVDKAKVDVISKLPHPTTVKGIRRFLGHDGFYRRFIQDFLKIARPMTRILEKDTPLFFSKECVEAFQTLKKKLTEAPILIASD
nr:reverse transcriptase domain-containing protein [Tanacetum cinerariifolium]